MSQPSVEIQEFEGRFREEASAIPGNFFICVRTYDASGKLVRTDSSKEGILEYFEGIKSQGHDPEALLALVGMAKSLAEK